MTTPHEIAATLNARQAQLRAEITAAEQAGREDQPSAEHEVSDRKDDAAWQQRSSVDDAQLARDRAELADVQAALQRLQRGDHGRCADCGQAIAALRLQVQPAALRCTACQTEHERRAHRPGTAA